MHTVLLCFVLLWLYFEFQMDSLAGILFTNNLYGSTKGNYSIATEVKP